LDNKLVLIGHLGRKIAFLNMDKNEAIERYCDINGIEQLKSSVDIDVIEFDNHFKVYDAWESVHDGQEC
jgi:predicted nucleotide-binding protein